MKLPTPILFFKKDILIFSIPFNLINENYYPTRYYWIRGKIYDIEKENEIKKIPIIKSHQNESLTDITKRLDYILKKKAGYLRDDNLKDASYACLEKAIELMSHSDIDWNKEDFLTIVKWLYFDNRIEESKKWELKLKKQCPKIFNESYQNTHLFNQILENCRSLKTDLVEANYYENCSSEMAKYRGRIYSISGKDKRFPKLTKEIIDTVQIFHPYVYGISKPTHCKIGDEIHFSNRPFIDDRTNEEKDNYINTTRIMQQRNDRSYWETVRLNTIEKNYYTKLLEKFPDITPKSFGAYKRLKNSNNPKYKLLYEKAKELNIDLNNIK